MRSVSLLSFPNFYSLTGDPPMFQQLASAHTEELDITKFTSRMEACLEKLGMLSARPQQGAFDILLQETLLVQLTILPGFCARVKSSTGQLRVLQCLCQHQNAEHHE